MSCKGLHTRLPSPTSRVDSTWVRLEHSSESNHVDASFPFSSSPVHPSSSSSASGFCISIDVVTMFKSTSSAANIFVFLLIVRTRTKDIRRFLLLQ